MLSTNVPKSDPHEVLLEKVRLMEKAIKTNSNKAEQAAMLRNLAVLRIRIKGMQDENRARLAMVQERNHRAIEQLHGLSDEVQVRAEGYGRMEADEEEDQEAADIMLGSFRGRRDRRRMLQLRDPQDHMTTMSTDCGSTYAGSIACSTPQGGSMSCPSYLSDSMSFGEGRSAMEHGELVQLEDQHLGEYLSASIRGRTARRRIKARLVEYQADQCNPQAPPQTLQTETETVFIETEWGLREVETSRLDAAGMPVDAESTPASPEPAPLRPRPAPLLVPEPERAADRAPALPVASPEPAPLLAGRRYSLPLPAPLLAPEPLLAAPEPEPVVPSPRLVVPATEEVCASPPPHPLQLLRTPSPVWASADAPRGSRLAFPIAREPFTVAGAVALPVPDAWSPLSAWIGAC